MDPLVQSSQKLQSRYGVQQSQFNRIGVGGGVASKPVAAPKGPDYLGNVFNSIKSGVGAGAGAVGGFLHKSLIEEPSAWGKYVGGNLNTFARVPLNAIQNYQQYQKDHNFEAYRQAQKGLIGATTDSFRGSIGGVPTKELVEKGLPVGMTAASVALPFVKGGTAAKAIGSAGDLSLGQKAANTATKFGSDIFTGSGNLAGNFTNPILNNAVKAGSGLTYNALVTRPTIDSLTQAPQDINNLVHGQDIGNSAFNLAGIAAPAILTGGQKLAKGATKFIGKNIFDTSGVFDKIVLKTGKTINQDMRAFAKEAAQVGSDNPKLARKATQMENKLRVLQDLVLQEHGGNHNLAAQALKDWQSSERQFSKMDLEQAIKEATRHFEARLVTQKMAKAGAFGEQFINGKGVAVGRLTKVDKTAIIERLKNSDDMAREVQLMRKEGLIKNDNLYGEIQDMVKGGNKDYAIDSVKQLTASDPLKGTKDFGNGYFSVYNKDAGVVKKASETAKLVEGKSAKFGFIGDKIRKAGLSPEQMTAEDNRAAFNKFKNAFQSKIDGIGDKSAKSLYKDLNKLAERTPGVTDIRQLTSRKIASELNLTVTEAKQIIKASKDSYKVLSTAERGLAGKLMDFNLRVNPLAAPYSRAQSLARYEWNPFFRLQENVETRTGLAALGGKNVMPRTHKYDETIKKLKGENGIFTSGYGGEGADSFSGSFSGVGAKISRDQESNIAASIEKFAGGPQNVDKWLMNPKNADLLNDIKTVVQYPDKGFTSSNLAKMMNLVSFPSRYNLKVTGFAVKQLAKQPAMTQIAVIRGLGDFNEFAKSPEGIKWQADNKEVIGLFKYLTPVMPIASVYQTLSGQNKSLMDTGMMGGLPFGLIQRVLQGQGVLKDRTPYVDPRTGKVYSDRVPEDLKARAESLLSSIVDTLYTYPGRTAGMQTSKKQLTQSITDNLSFGQLKGGKYSETERSGDVTPEQQNQIKILQSMPGNAPKFSNNPTEFVQTTNYKPAPAGNFPSIYKKAKKGKKAKPIAKPIGSFL